MQKNSLKTWCEALPMSSFQVSSKNQVTSLKYFLESVLIKVYIVMGQH